MDQRAQGFERERQVEKEIQGIKNYRKFCIVVYNKRKKGKMSKITLH